MPERRFPSLRLQILQMMAEDNPLFVGPFEKAFTEFVKPIIEVPNLRYVPPVVPEAGPGVDEPGERKQTAA